MCGWLWNDAVGSGMVCKLTPALMLGWAALVGTATTVEILLAWDKRVRLGQSLFAVLTVAALGVCAIFIARAVWFVASGCAS
jgi:hypothetical protein